MHQRGERRALDRQWLRYLQERAAPLSSLADLDPPPGLSPAVQLLTAGEFTASHEAWEVLWREATYPVRLFYLAMAKLTAGLEQARRGNSKGAVRLVSDGLQFLKPFQPSIMRLDTAQIEETMSRWLGQQRRGERPIAAAPTQVIRIAPTANDPTHERKRGGSS